MSDARGGARSGAILLREDARAGRNIQTTDADNGSGTLEQLGTVNKVQN